MELNPRNLRTHIENYSREHGNDFGIPDGMDRIPMKKLMKLFEIKKKTAPEKQNLFRQIVNDHCDLEVMEGFGKVLILKQHVEGYHNDESSNSDDEPDYGYENGDPKMADTVPELKKADSDGDLGSSTRTGRFKPPQASASGGLTVATAESDRNNGVARRTGYRRRGSVTRYSIVGHDQVVNEYKKHEDVINQFRRDSLKLEHNIRNLTLETLESSKEFTTNDSEIDTFESNPKRLSSPMANKDVSRGTNLKGNSVKKLFGRARTRFSLAF